MDENLLIRVTLKPLATARTAENILQATVGLFVQCRRMLGLHNLEERGLRMQWLQRYFKTSREAKM